MTEPDAEIRAWVDYYRDLGIHDFYRLGDRVETGEALPGRVEPAIAAMPSKRLEVERDRAQPAVIAVAVPGVAAKVWVARDDSSFALSSDESGRTDERAGAEIAAVKLVSFNDLAPPPGAALDAGERALALTAIRQEIGDCTRCPLAYAGRRTIVFGDGAATARLMFVGEGPGADEDASGLPFVGKAGQLLNNMIAAMGLARADVYIANIVKCRPPANRVPEPVEAGTCSQFLVRQIDTVRPEVIVALGSTAATYLLGVKQALGGLRGRWHHCRGAKVAVTYHPAFLLRDPRMKGEAWKDLQMVMAEMGLTGPKRG